MGKLKFTLKITENEDETIECSSKLKGNGGLLVAMVAQSLLAQITQGNEHMFQVLDEAIDCVKEAVKYQDPEEGLKLVILRRVRQAKAMGGDGEIPEKLKQIISVLGEIFGEESGK